MSLFVGGTGNANELNDFETGSFTPVFSQGRSGTITYQHQIGFYTKIGNRVFAQIYMQMSGGSTNTSAVLIGGMPFSCTSTSSREGGGYHTYQNAFFDSGAPRDNHPWIAVNSSSVIFYRTSDGGAVTGNQTTTNQNYLIFHLQYIVA